jgi:sec-independent protein translocase protein TatA
MGSFSIWHWLIVLVVILLLFGGGGKIPKLMGDLARGIKSFKTGLKDEETTADGQKTIPAAASVEPARSKDGATQG